jgi:uncharacterized protein
MRDDRWTALDPQECTALLARSRLGRVALLVDGAPMILPVNFVVDDGGIVFRTSPASPLAAADRAVVAFEIDGIDLRSHTGWSVLVRGRAHQVTAADEVARLEKVNLVPWAPGSRPLYITITPAETTGRRIDVPDLPSNYWG